MHLKSHSQLNKAFPQGDAGIGFVKICEGVKKMIDIGRIVIKTAGRESLRKAVVVDIIDKNYALITGPPSLTGIKRRRVNIGHLEPTNRRLEITRKATDADVLAAAKAANLDAFIKERVQINV